MTDENATVQLLEEPPLPRKQKVAYGFGNMARNILGIAQGGAMTFLYNVKFGLNYNLVSLAWLIFSIWNALNNPLFGIIEDRTHSKVGRHIPYIRYGAPVYGALFVLAWFPFWSDQWGLFINLLVMLVSFNTLDTMIGLVTFALPAEMTVTAKNRTNLMLYSVAIGSGGVLLSNLLPLLLLTGNHSPQLNPLFQPTMVVLGVSCAVTLFVCSFFLKENEFAQREEPLGFISAIKETFKNPPFLRYLVYSFCNTIVITAISVGIFYFIDYILQLSSLFDYVQLLPLGLAAVIGIFLGPRWVGRFGAKKVFIFGLAIMGIGFIGTVFAGLAITGALITLCPAVLGYGVISITGPAIVADVMDYDEVLTGKRRETTYAGINALITKPAIFLATAMFLMISGALGFDASRTVQTTSAKVGILVGIFLVPGILLLVSAAVFAKFPLDGPAWVEQKRRLGEIHRQKELDYLTYLKEKGWLKLDIDANRST